MADRWTWTASQWADIVSLARAERSNRRAAHDKDPISVVRRGGSLARANEAAACMRQWAARAEFGARR